MIGYVPMRVVWRWDCPECGAVNDEDVHKGEPEFSEPSAILVCTSLLCRECLGNFENQFIQPDESDE